MYSKARPRARRDLREIVEAAVSAHVPSCQCAKCKPPLGPAMPAEGERFRVFIELSFEIAAKDYYTARCVADTIGRGCAQVLSVARDSTPVDVRTLSVERKET